MARLSTGGSDNSLRHEHPSDIFRTCFAPHEDNFFALGRHQLGFLGAEYGLAHSGAWHRVYSRGQFSFCEFGLRHRRIDHRVEKPFDILGLDALDGLYLGNEAFLRHIHRNLERRGRGALPHPRLQHVELAFLDRKFHVLHVAVMFFKQHAHLFELLVHLGHQPRHFSQVHRRANASDNVFSLRVDQEISVKNFFPGRRVASETHARARVFSDVAKHHLHDVHGRSQQARDAFHAPVRHGLLGIPRSKNGSDRSPELLLRVLRKILRRSFLEVRFVLTDQFPPALGRHLRVVLHPAARLHDAQFFFKFFFR